MRIVERARSVLIVEDNVRLVTLLERALREHGFVVRAARDRESALVTALANEPDVFILDIGLRRPDDGIELIQELRARGIGAPALMLTGRNGVGDRIAGLDAGADDYLGKPFEVDELIARIRALLRRAHGRERNPRLVVGNLALDSVTREVHRGKRKLSLTQREFAVLEYFMRNAGKELTRAAIAEQVWGGPPAAEAGRPWLWTDAAHRSRRRLRAPGAFASPRTKKRRRQCAAFSFPPLSLTDRSSARRCRCSPDRPATDRRASRSSRYSH